MVKILAAGEAEQIQLSVLVFSMFLFLFSNLYPFCQSRVSFGYSDFQGTSPQGALYPLGHFTLWGPLTLGAFCPQGHFALHDLLLFESFRLFGNFGFFSYCRQLGLKGLQSCFSNHSMLKGAVIGLLHLYTKIVFAIFRSHSKF